MKYILHHKDGSGYYVGLSGKEGNFSWQDTIKKATRFDNISEILTFVHLHGYQLGRKNPPSTLDTVRKIFNHRVEILVVDEEW